MNIDKKYLWRCIELARNGIGNVAPNPMVGCVIVSKYKIIGEGYHICFGKPHAEVNAINSVKDKKLLNSSTLYVNLEPCSHYGKTPPCTDLIIKHKIPNIVIGCIDTFSKVSGNGVKQLRDAGCNVFVGVLEKESRELNKRFFTYNEKKRPYVILKWAQTIDGFIDIKRDNTVEAKPTWITDKNLKMLVHKWRAEEPAILIGTNTAKKDNPKLTVREWTGKNPLRVVLDNKLKLNNDLHIFDKTSPTLVLTSVKHKSEHNLDYDIIDFKKDVALQILEKLYQRDIQSVFVEGGKMLLDTFIKADLWDEARVFIGNKKFYNGIKAPDISKDKMISNELAGNDRLLFFRNL